MELVVNTQGILEFVSQPWHWAVSGAAIAFMVFLMTWLGRKFGISTSFEVACSLMGAGKRTNYFQRNFKDDIWRVLFVVGAIIGGFVATTFLSSPEPVAISVSTIEYLSSVGVAYPESDSSNLGFIPTSIFNFSSLKGIILGIIGGFLVGFGARYGGGCTSGHGVTGLAHLQLPSLLTVIGFFIGGLVMTHLLMPTLLAW